jgi:RHS repeat-associated protein
MALDYFGARYLHSATGRFTAVDPLFTIPENIVDPQRWNRYVYVRNNPHRYVDPDGRAVQAAIGAITGVGFGWAIATLTGDNYTAGDALRDAALGAVGAGLASKGMKAYRAYRLVKGLGAVESAIMREASAILGSAEMEAVRAAHAAGKAITVRIGGRMIQYEPELAASGMTAFGQNGFLIGREAFGSVGELEKTLLHELYRLYTSQNAAGVSAGLAAAETNAASNFAEHMIERLVR